MAIINPFPHIRLKMVRDVSRKKRTTPFIPQRSLQTKTNLQNRTQHANTLGSSVHLVHREWQDNIEVRKANGYPDLPEAISLS
ncbi:MAG: hypothetical protein WA125_14075 [Desulfosporosinus sp.]